MTDSTDELMRSYEVIAASLKIPAEAFTLVAKPGELTTDEVRDRLHRIADGEDEEAFYSELDHAELIIENLVYDFPYRKAQLLDCLHTYVGRIEDGEFDPW